jgi:hypothetical protein
MCFKKPLNSYSQFTICVTVRAYHYRHHRRLVQFLQESNFPFPPEPQKTLHRPTSSRYKQSRHNRVIPSNSILEDNQVPYTLFVEAAAAEINPS